MHLVPLAARSVDEALAAGPTLRESASKGRAPWFAASLIEGPAVLLGAHQLAGSVLEVAACREKGVRVFRRSTSGTAAFAGRRALVFTLALPDVAALFPDASPRTLLNRNVRPFLKGFSAAGALAHYFGREWVSFRKRPGALLGFEVGDDGVVLVEVIVGFDDSIAIPAELATARERSVARFTDHEPACLAELLPAGAAPERVAGCVADAFAARASTPVSTHADLPDAAPRPSFELDLTLPLDLALDLAPALSTRDPLPPGATLLPPTRVPIGWLELALLPPAAAPLLTTATPPRIWLGGDILAPRALLDHLATAATASSVSSPSTAPSLLPTDLPTAPLEGVSLPEIFAAVRATLTR